MRLLITLPFFSPLGSLWKHLSANLSQLVAGYPLGWEPIKYHHQSLLHQPSLKIISTLLSSFIITVQSHSPQKSKGQNSNHGMSVKSKVWDSSTLYSPSLNPESVHHKSLCVFLPKENKSFHFQNLSLIQKTVFFIHCQVFFDDCIILKHR